MRPDICINLLDCYMLEYCMPKVKKSASEYCKELKLEAEEGRCT